MGNARANQVITTYGPGSIIDLVDYAVMVVNADYWLKPQYADLIIQDLRIQFLIESTIRELSEYRIKNIRGLMMPPIDESKFSASSKSLGSIGAIRFPMYHRCSKCKVLCKLKPHSTDTKCNHESNAQGSISCSQLPPYQKGTLEPVRFILKCPDGHVDDLNWHMYMKKKCMKQHQDSHSKQTSNELSCYYLNESSKGDFFKSISIHCRVCNTNHDLTEIMRKTSQTETPAENPSDFELYTCNGSRHWDPDHSKEDCSARVKMVPRGQADVYVAEIIPSISIPKLGFEALDLDHVKYIEVIFKNVDEPLSNDDFSIRYTDFIEDSLMENQTLDGYYSYLVSAYKSKENTNHQDKVSAYLQEEYQSLTSTIHDIDFISSPIDISNNDFIKKYFSKISKIERIKLITSLIGFKRSFSDEQTRFHPSTKNGGFVPSTTSFGEGIFLEFNDDELQNWTNINKAEIADRNKLLQSRSDLTTQSFKDTVYSMLHSFSHMLMHELAYYSGFSVNELAEKIYFMDSPISTRGLLIYTRSGDSQCSMGGLSDLVSAEILEKIIKSALMKALSCSHDPFCSISEGQGNGALTHAGCFGCIMTPEICCENFPIKNSFLDRGLLIDLNGKFKPFFEINDA